MRVGILHPGQMGISIAASAQKSGNVVYWVSAGRSPQTQARANQFGLLDAQSLAQFCTTCEIIISICPPESAESVAESVASHGFRGLYVDANAISPQRAIKMGHMMTQAGATFVDGGIIGGPAWEPNSTWLYLAGKDAQRVADCFVESPLETSIISDAIGKASALKMCFAAYSKGTTALLCAILAAAEAYDVRHELEAQWAQDGSDFAMQTIQRTRNVTAKAWRFAGEMEEIAATFSEVDLPNGFHLAANDIYRRLAGFKDAPNTPPLEEVLAALLSRST